METSKINHTNQSGKDIYQYAVDTKAGVPTSHLVVPAPSVRQFVDTSSSFYYTFFGYITSLVYTT
jgi:hypothetical protein